MNALFWFLVILVLTILWFLLSFVFRPIGKISYRIWEDTKEIINKEEPNNKEEKE